MGKKNGNLQYICPHFLLLLRCIYAQHFLPTTQFRTEEKRDKIGTKIVTKRKRIDYQYILGWQFYRYIDYDYEKERERESKQED